MSAESTGSRTFTYWRLRFHDWRGSRPFWAGLFTLAGGGPIIYFPYANMHLGNMTIAMSTTGGAGSLIIGALLITLGVTMWFHSVVRVFAGIAAILLALISLPVSNIGGFILGFLLSALGGALALSWAPAKPDRAPAVPTEGEPEGVSPQGGTPDGPERVSGFDAFRPAIVPGQQPAAHNDTTVDANGGRHRAG
ncbi:DUF6114 domain-containing protein [Streptomyces sp. NPDC051322]|uniref:DUF6114 domain-containing protein n=1 Tax=Streptomyces sp. NPDC051322 TaxID=3154645 RepID=UPI00344C5337